MEFGSTCDEKCLHVDEVTMETCIRFLLLSQSLIKRAHPYVTPLLSQDEEAESRNSSARQVNKPEIRSKPAM